MLQIDLNCDLGESFGAYKIGMDTDVIPLISSANIACGFHASDPMVMSDTVKLAVQNKVALGAHPGFPDLVGFGRRNLKVSNEEAEAYVVYQIGALSAFATINGAKLNHVKLHGALYNMAAKDLSLAKAICSGIKKINPELKLIALSGSCMVKAAEEIGLPYLNEVFADRAYNDDGTLVSRTEKGSVITDTNVVVQRVVRMIEENVVETITGKIISITPNTVCVHGDNPEALNLIKEMRKEFLQRGIEIKAS